MNKNTGLDKGYQLIVTGHSLGGAWADVFLYLAMINSIVSKEKNRPIIVTYGQPKTGNLDFAIEIEKLSYAKFRIVNKYDGVAKVPFVSYYETYNSTTSKITKYKYKYTDNYQSFEIYDGKMSSRFIEEREEENGVNKAVTFTESRYAIGSTPTQIMERLTGGSSNINKVGESEIMTFKGEDKDQLYQQLMDDMDDTYSNDIAPILVGGVVAILLAALGIAADKAIKKHTSYFDMSIGSYCAVDEFKSSSLVSLKYTFLFTLLALILL